MYFLRNGEKVGKLAWKVYDVIWWNSLRSAIYNTRKKKDGIPFRLAEQLLVKILREYRNEAE